jgi:hypothetical protein
MNGHQARPDWLGTNFPEFRNVPAGWEAPLGYNLREWEWGLLV